MQGEFVAVMGPSGSGKSTFMNILGCLDTPTRGRYLLEGNDTSRSALRPAGARCAIASSASCSRASTCCRAPLCVDNVALPLVYAGVRKSEREARARELLERVGLERYGAAHAKPDLRRPAAARGHRTRAGQPPAS